MAKYAAPGHKLGQMIGNFFEDFFAEDLVKLSQKHGLYCDCKTIRANKKEMPKKVTWTDKDGNNHDLDYVIEKRKAPQERGVPVAFIELAWRRCIPNILEIRREKLKALYFLSEIHS